MTAKTNNESIKSHIMIKILLNTIQIHKSTDIRTTKIMLKDYDMNCMQGRSKSGKSRKSSNKNHPNYSQMTMNSVTNLRSS
jgi:hypothetical protein